MSIIKECGRLTYFKIGLIGLLLVMSCFIHPINDTSGYSENPAQLVDEPESRTSASTRAELVEQNEHGGCWLDSFVDDSGVDWGLSSDKINLSDSEAKVDADKFTYEDFESGSVGTVPAQWVKEEYKVGSCTAEHDLKIVNDRYYNGQQSVYVYSKVTSAGGGSKGSHTNLTNKNYIDVRGSEKVYFHISNIATSHTGAWGWNAYIIASFFDGANSAHERLFWNGQFAPGGEQNNYSLKSLGADGNEWFQYNVTIPPNIDKTHLKLRIRFVAGCWTPMGSHSSISGNVDKIYFDLQQMNFTSKPIQLPEAMEWDTLILNFNQPLNTNLYVDILDPSTNKPIPGSLTYSGAYEYDLSYIDANDYASIRLNANFERNTAETPVLYYWGISWRLNASWHDTFFGGDKIGSALNVDVEDGDAAFDNGESIISKAISVPEGYYFDELRVCKTEPTDSSISITILDAGSDLPITGFEDIANDNLSLMGVNPHLYPSIKLKAVFETTAIQTGTLHGWSVNWTGNSAPVITKVLSESLVDRSKCCTISVYAQDREDDIGNLTLTVEYLPPESSQWQSGYISGMKLVGGQWYCTFLPDIDAELGNYTFRFRCEDSFGLSYVYPHEIVVEVYTKILPVPELEIEPIRPYTKDDLSVKITNLELIDSLLDEYELWYRWYKNYFYDAELDNVTVISSQITVKSDVWRCRVVIFDGIDESAPDVAEVTIRNSPPVIKMQIKDYEMLEDSLLILNEKVEDIFEDPDGDVMVYGISSQDNIVVDISAIDGGITLTPEPDWFGTQNFLLYANDTESQSTVAFNVTVKPTNDLPVIKQVGDEPIEKDQAEVTFEVNQDELLNLTIIVIDIDGDDDRGLLKINISTPDSENLKFGEAVREILFFPENSDVGWHEFEINVTDGNTTPPEYVTLPVKIKVLNLNDMPSVQILTPEDGKKYYSDDKLAFTCTAEDIDLLIPDSKERLSYRWYISTPGVVDLGYTPELVNVTFEPGEYFITLELTDRAGEKAYDSVTITVEESVSTNVSILANYYLWIIIAAIIMIIIALLLVIRSRRRRKEEIEAADKPVTAITPELVAEPQIGLSSIGEVKPALGATSGAPAVLPGSTQLPPPDPAFQQKIQEKKRVLDELLSRGEIDQLTHQMTMLKFEEDLKYHQAKAKPLPQLPPANVSKEEGRGGFEGAESGVQRLAVESVPQPQPQAQPTQATPAAAKPKAIDTVVLRSQPQPQATPQPAPQPQPQAQPQPQPKPVPIAVTLPDQEDKADDGSKEETKNIDDIFDFDKKDADGTEVKKSTEETEQRTD